MVRGGGETDSCYRQGVPVLNPLTFSAPDGCPLPFGAFCVFPDVTTLTPDGPDMIQKSIIIAKLRERGQDARANWVDRELPDDVDPLLHGGLLSTLHLDLKELESPPPSAPAT